MDKEEWINENIGHLQTLYEYFVKYFSKTDLNINWDNKFRDFCNLMFETSEILP